MLSQPVSERPLPYFVILDSYIRPKNNAALVSVPCSDSNLSSRGSIAAVSSSAWKKLTCMSG